MSPAAAARFSDDRLEPWPKCATCHRTERGPELRCGHVFDGSIQDWGTPCGGGVVSELRSALEPFRTESLPELADGRIEEDLVELQRASELIELERLRRVGEIERRGSFGADGHLSITAWLVDRCRMGWGAARDEVRMARGFASMATTRAAVDDGELSMAAARVLVGAREADPEAFGEAEAALVHAARVHPVSDLRRVVAFWKDRVEREQGEQGADLRSGRRLHASVTFDGMVRVDGDLDPLTGESLLTALAAVLDAEARTRGPDDERTPAQRRADALGEVCRGFLDRGDRPVVAGERPHLTITVPVEVLAGSAGGASGSPDGAADPGRMDLAGMAELGHAGPVPAELARQLACDASVMRVVLGARSEPLDVGRRTPVVSPAIRRAVILRDRHCRFPGCDRPQAWCDAHHVTHWADGGRTALENLLLLCRRHHGLVHRPGGFGLAIEGGAPVFRRADGSVLQDRGPP